MKKFLLALPILVTSAFAAYEDHFPTYFEYCTGTQWKLQNGEVGGSPGHGFTYIHGLCKDYRSAYPQVIPCSEVSAKLKAKYPHGGVGISLDKNFSNVMWVAVPGREFMLNGNLESQPISMEQVRAHIQKINELKVFDEVISKSEVMKDKVPGTQEYLEALAEDTLGTDHAVNWARELHCVKIPAPASKISQVAKFLNDSNNQYKTGPGYVWSKLTNNCVHLSINQSHAMDISKSIKLDQKGPSMLTNMALPANGFLMYADLAVVGKGPSNRLLSKELSQDGFHVRQLGSIMEVHKAFPSGEKFNTDDLSVLTAPRVKKPLKLLTTPRKYEKKYMTPENSELKANAAMWIERYQELLADLKKDERGGVVEQYLKKQIELAKKVESAEN